MLIKRAFDFVAASCGLVLLLPLLFIAALLIKFDSAGPVLFRQKRVGIAGTTFDIYKFRTMAVDTEAKGQITVGRDPRITRVGAILRKFKIDELPQLMNVVRGEMSLVGPRPEVPRYVALYPEDLRQTVLSVRPGITDLASIAFKDENAILAEAVDPEKSYVETILPIKLEYYERYVRQRNFFLDLKIILMTFIAIAWRHEKRGRA